MFLIRTLFWLGLVIALIPVDDKEAAARAEEAVPVDAGAAIVAAQQTVSDLGGFCGRNPTACDVGGRIATTMALKAQTGARIVYEFIDAQMAPAAEPGRPTGGDTLSGADRTPAWQAPVAGRDA